MDVSAFNHMNRLRTISQHCKGEYHTKRYDCICTCDVTLDLLQSICLACVVSRLMASVEPHLGWPATRGCTGWRAASSVPLAVCSCHGLHRSAGRCSPCAHLVGPPSPPPFFVHSRSLLAGNAGQAQVPRAVLRLLSTQAHLQ